MVQGRSLSVAAGGTLQQDNVPGNYRTLAQDIELPDWPNKAGNRRAANKSQPEEKNVDILLPFAAEDSNLGPKYDTLYSYPSATGKMMFK